VEPLDEGVGLIAGELATRLALGEAHRAAGVPEIRVAGLLEEFGQLLELAERCRRARRLTEGHGGSLAQPALRHHP
jgi:hypothetical protein